MTRTVLAAVVAVVGIVAFIAFDAPTSAQGEDTTGRIVARLLDDGHAEFGWLPAGASLASVASRALLPTDAQINRWLPSSPVTVAGVEIGRINARRLSDRRIEFVFFTTDGEYIRPERRYIPTNVNHSRWLRSTEITVPIPGLGPDDSGLAPTRAERKNLLVERLFDLRPGTADKLTHHDYNDWGCDVMGAFLADCNASKSEKKKVARRVQMQEWAYDGGHSGWDVAHRHTKPQFYSLSEGTVIADGGTAWPCNDIAVYDEHAEKTTIYLHAAKVLVRVGDPVSVGTPLGTEGTRCRRPVGKHIHLEVRNGKAVAATGEQWNNVKVTWRIYARGAGQSDQSNHPRSDYSIDPLPYLFEQVCGGSGVSLAVRGVAICGGMLIREDDSPEVYVVKAKNGKYFRRHIVTHELYNAEIGWSGENVLSVTAAAFAQIRHSPLVRLPGDAKSVYLVEEMDEDDIVLRHIPSAAIFNNASCDWDGVFAMSRGEYSYWTERAAQRGVPLRGGPIDATYRCPQ